MKNERRDCDCGIQLTIVVVAAVVVVVAGWVVAVFIERESKFEHTRHMKNERRDCGTRLTVVVAAAVVVVVAGWVVVVFLKESRSLSIQHMKNEHRDCVVPDLPLSWRPRWLSSLLVG